MTIKGARIPPNRAPTESKPMADGLRVVGKISELQMLICVWIYFRQKMVEPVNVDHRKAGCKTKLAKKSKGRNNKGKTVCEQLDTQAGQPTH